MIQFHMIIVSFMIARHLIAYFASVSFDSLVLFEIMFPGIALPLKMTGASFMSAREWPYIRMYHLMFVQRWNSFESSFAYITNVFCWTMTFQMTLEILQKSVYFSVILSSNLHPKTLLFWKWPCTNDMKNL